MGLAALLGAVLILLALVALILYGTYVGIVRSGFLVWRFLLGMIVDRSAPDSGKDRLNSPCWEDKNCPPADRETCPAYTHSGEGLPCWQTVLRTEGRLKPGCLTCKGFKVAGILA